MLEIKHPLDEQPAIACDRVGGKRRVGVIVGNRPWNPALFEERDQVTLTNWKKAPHVNRRPVAPCGPFGRECQRRLEPDLAQIVLLYPANLGVLEQRLDRYCDPR